MDSVTILEFEDQIKVFGFINIRTIHGPMAIVVSLLTNDLIIVFPVNYSSEICHGLFVKVNVLQRWFHSYHVS
jgi:hypothetical protein